jgi:hypothetical protein
MGNQQKNNTKRTKNHNTVDRQGWEMARVVHVPTQEGLSMARNIKVDHQRQRQMKAERGSRASMRRQTWNHCWHVQATL